MIKAKIYLENKSVIGFVISGHAGSGESGKDIVCSAVSAIAYTALGTLDELIKKPDFTEKDGEMTFFLTKPKEQKLLEKAYIILETVRIGLLQIQDSYPEYLEVEIKEESK